MSKLLDKTKNRNVTHRRTYKISTSDRFIPYWDEGYHWHKSRGNRNKKEILPYQYRMYRTWKYNRKTQWKITNR